MLCCIIKHLSGNVYSESIPLCANQLSINGMKITDIKFNNFYILKLCRTTLLPKYKPFLNSLYVQIE